MECRKPLHTALAQAALAGTLCASLAACSSKSNGGEGSIHIRFPTAAESVQHSAPSSSSKLSTMVAGFDWSLVCYIVNVTAVDIPAQPAATCDIPVGTLAGSVAPGGELSLNVAKGPKRKVEVLIYQRSAASDACPVLEKNFGRLSRTRLARVGQVDGLNIVDAVVDVSVDISAPATNATLVTQYGLPNSCQPSVPPTGAATSRVTLGHEIIRGSGLTISGSIAPQQSEKVLTGGGLTIHLSRSLQ